MSGATDRERYLRQLGIEPAAATLKAALDRAHDLRRFEIENYWRRSTYFWGFQLAALAALAIARQSSQLSGAVLMVVAILGVVTAYTGVLTARGSKFWQRNWEAHVDLLEDENEGRLHKTVLLRRDDVLPPSVSDANERLWQVLTGGWGAAFIYGTWLSSDIDADASLDPCKLARLVLLWAAALVAIGWMAATRRSGVDERAWRLAPFERFRERSG